jgi:hypothetical protein
MRQLPVFYLSGVSEPTDGLLPFERATSIALRIHFSSASSDIPTYPRRIAAGRTNSQFSINIARRQMIRSAVCALSDEQEFSYENIDPEAGSDYWRVERDRRCDS